MRESIPSEDVTWQPERSRDPVNFVFCATSRAADGDHSSSQALEIWSTPVYSKHDMTFLATPGLASVLMSLGRLGHRLDFLGGPTFALTKHMNRLSNLPLQERLPWTVDEVQRRTKLINRLGPKTLSQDNGQA